MVFGWQVFAVYLKLSSDVPLFVKIFSATIGQLTNNWTGESTDTRSKGLELRARMRRIPGISSELSYSFSAMDVKYPATNSLTRSSASGEYYVSEFNQPHRFRALVDYSLVGDVEAESFGATLFANIMSGHSYTPILEPSSLGTATPWNIGVMPLTDRRRSVPSGDVGSATTAWNWSLDIQLRTGFQLGSMNIGVYAVVVNLLNKKNVLNVYPQTGHADDDGWLGSPYSASYRSIQNYEAFYRAINLDNRWAYGTYAGGAIYGSPRQFWLGVRVGG